jgi:large conductance mechanosensitive channel
MQAMKVDELAKLAYQGIKYGNFLAAVLNFLFVAFVIFLLVRPINHMTKQPEKPALPLLPADVQFYGNPQSTKAPTGPLVSAQG